MSQDELRRLVDSSFVSSMPHTAMKRRSEEDSQPFLRVTRSRSRVRPEYPTNESTPIPPIENDLLRMIEPPSPESDATIIDEDIPMSPILFETDSETELIESTVNEASDTQSQETEQSSDEFVRTILATDVIETYMARFTGPDNNGFKSGRKFECILGAAKRNNSFIFLTKFEDSVEIIPLEVMRRVAHDVLIDFFVSKAIQS